MNIKDFEKEYYRRFQRKPEVVEVLHQDSESITATVVHKNGPLTDTRTFTAWEGLIGE